MIDRGTFSDGKEIFDVGLMIKMNRDASHKEVHRRRHRDRLPADVDAAVFHAQVTHFRNAPADLLLSQKSDIEKNFFSGFLYFVNFTADHIAGHQIPLRPVFVLHEINSVSVLFVKEPAALSAHSLRDQHPLLHCLQRCGMILDKFQVL